MVNAARIEGRTAEDLRIALNAMEQSLPLGGKAKLELYTDTLPTEEELANTVLNMAAAGFHASYPSARIVQNVPTIEVVLTKGSPQWAALIPIIPTVVIVGLIAFGITRIETISKALLPILITTAVTGVIIIGVMRAPAALAAERAAKRYLPKA